MKKFQFKSQESIIKGIEEKPIKKGFNWDRVIYFATLLIIVLSFGTYFISKQVRVSAESEIIMDKFNVTFTDDIIVTEYFIEEGDSIKAGDSLFTYRLDLEDDGGLAAALANSNDANYSKSTESWLTREKLNTLKNIDLKRIELRDVSRRTQLLERDLDKIKKEVFLEIYPPSKLQTAEEKIEELKNEQLTIKEEINYLSRYLDVTIQRLEELRSQIPNVQLGEMNGVVAGDGGGIQEEFVYYSPKDGMVSQVYARSDEVCYKQSLVTDIIEFQGLHILSYFKQKDLKFITSGDIVDIKFPDGSKSKGIIDKLYIKTTVLPDRLYDTDSNSDRRVRAVIVPLNIEDASKWFEFYKINVTVSKPKYF
jgi:multidrug resistance efflux pump